MFPLEVPQCLQCKLNDRRFDYKDIEFTLKTQRKTSSGNAIELLKFLLVFLDSALENV